MTVSGHRITYSLRVGTRLTPRLRMAGTRTEVDYPMYGKDDFRVKLSYRHIVATVSIEVACKVVVCGEHKVKELGAVPKTLRGSQTNYRQVLATANIDTASEELRKRRLKNMTSAGVY
jgi:hypothetical protein